MLLIGSVFYWSKRMSRKLQINVLTAMCLILGCATPLMGQENTDKPQAEHPGNTENMSKLDAAWMGTWKGEARSLSAKGTGATFTMSIEIKEIKDANRYQWRTVYSGAQGDMVKAYELLPQPEPNRFVVDEKNSIMIEATMLDDTLSSHFTVQGQTIWCQYRLVADGDEKYIEFDLYAATNSDAKISGGEKGIPEVTSLIPTTRQTAKLVKQK